jgi:fimbrial chaperone protein
VGIAFFGGVYMTGRKNRIHLRCVYTTLFLVVLSVASIGAFSFDPITMDFAPSGPNSSKTFRVENNTTSLVAVKISMVSRKMASDGAEINTDASDSFIVYPSQVLLQPGGFQAVRVKWTGRAATANEISFRIIAEQLPVNAAKSQTGGKINIILKYVGSVYILPENPASQIIVEKAAPHELDDGTKTLAIQLLNQGNAHGIILDLRLTVSSTDAQGRRTEATFVEDEAVGLHGANILAQSRRVFLLPWPDGLAEDGVLSVELDFNAVR